jgi:hypothetical protein
METILACNSVEVLQKNLNPAVQMLRGNIRPGLAAALCLSLLTLEIS